MIRLFVFLLCLSVCSAAHAFDRDEYPLIDLRARSMHGGLGTVSAKTQTSSSHNRLTSSQPAVQPVPAAYPPPQPVYAPPAYKAAPPPKTVAEDETAVDSQDVKENIKNNPQTLPDV